jgi:hypothetical protein
VHWKGLRWRNTSAAASTVADLERERQDVEGLHARSKESIYVAYLQKTNPKEWARQFDAWVNSHDPNAPVLSDEAGEPLRTLQPLHPQRVVRSAIKALTAQGRELHDCC